MPHECTMTSGNYYSAGPKPLGTAPLRNDMRADVCVIGGGFTGLSAALALAQAGVQVVLLEAQVIGFGASGRNGGQIHTGLRKEQAALEAWLGPVHARDLWQLCEEAKDLIPTLVRQHGIECSLKQGLVMAAHNARAAQALAEDAEHLARGYGYSKLTMWDGSKTRRELGADYHAARFDAGGGQIHPLAFALGLARAAQGTGAVLHEHSQVTRVAEVGMHVHVSCNGRKVIADKVVVALDAFTGNLLPQIARYIGQIESFIVATAPLGDDVEGWIIPCDAAVADTRHVLDYYRKDEGRLLFAGRESYFRVPQNVGPIVRPRMEMVFPMLKGFPIDYAWSGTVGVTRTRMPHFGKVGSRISFAHGYSGQGVALANLGGSLLAEEAMGMGERFDVFARVPAKPFPGGALLRRPLMAAGLLAYKLADKIY